MKKVLIVTERFWPEEFLVNDFAAAWKACGDEVEVLTQVPSYPFDRIYDGYENRRLQTTWYGDIPVHRVSTCLGYNRSVFQKVRNYLHFGWRTLCWALWHGRRYDRVFIYHTAALTMAASALVMRWVWRRPVTIWTQDLWPDAVWGYGFRRTWLREKVLNLLVRIIYASCGRVLVSSPGYVGYLVPRYCRQCEYVPQWELPRSESAAPIAWQKPTGALVFMFAGNLGVPQNLPRVIAGFRQFRRGGGEAAAKAQLHILGDGVMAAELRTLAADEPAIVFHGRRPHAEMPQWFAQADALIISLTHEYALTLPGKFQSYLTAGKAMFGVIEGAVADLIAANGLGATADPEDVGAIARGFAELCQANLAECGARAQRLSERDYNRELLIARLIGES